MHPRAYVVRHGLNPAQPVTFSDLMALADEGDDESGAQEGDGEAGAAADSARKTAAKRGARR